MVGTAVTQVALDSSSQEKNFSALNPGVAKMLAPAASELETAPISPWIWNSGMMLRQRSAGFSASVVPIWRAEAARLAWVRPTSFGREVVPDVWSRSAMSLDWAGPATDRPAPEGAANCSWNFPA